MLKSKAKEFIIVSIKVLAEILVMLFIIAFAVVPCAIIQTPYFIIPWVIFIMSLYVTIWYMVFNP